MKSASIVNLIEEVRLMFHCAARTASDIHRDEPVTVGMRGVMEYLHRWGPRSVPTIARARYVTRQHIQLLVNGLLEKNLAKATHNPAHKNSPLIALNETGLALLTRMKQRESKIYRRLAAQLDQASVDAASTTLKQIRQAMERQS